MKKFWILPVILCLVTLVISCSSETRTLKVIGTGEVKTQADFVMLVFAIETLNKNPKISQSINMDKSSKLINTIKKHDIADEDIYSIDYSLFPEYEYKRNGRVFNGYRSINKLSMKILKIDNYKDILVTMFENGVNKIDSITFGVNDLKKLQKEALLKASEDALSKATELAEKMNSGLGKVILADEITEKNVQPEYESKSRAAGLMNYGGFGGTSEMDKSIQIISSGSRSIESKILMIYEME